MIIMIYDKRNDKKEYDKKYYLKNREKILQQSKNYYRKNIESIKKRKKEYYQKNNSEKIKKHIRKYQKNNPEKRREYAKKYYLENKEKIKKKKIDYYYSIKNNPEKYKIMIYNKKEYSKKWRDKNKKYMKKYYREYYWKNIEKIYLKKKEWVKNNKEKVREIIRKENLRRKNKNIVHFFTVDEWVSKKNATNGICPSCNTFVGTEKLTLDHIFPVSKAEKRRIYTINDVQPLCKSCNSSKHDKIIINEMIK